MSLFISMSISGSVVLLFYIIFIHFSKNKFSFRWHMICLKIALFFYLVPIGYIKYLLPEPIWSVINAFEKSNAKVLKFSNMVSISWFGDDYYYIKKTMFLISLLWLLAALSYIMYQSIQYLRFRQKLLRTSVPLDGKEASLALEKFPELRNTYRRKKVNIYRNPYVEGPFTSGIFHPCIVLPPVEYVPEYSQDIFGHELYHIKNRDVVLKFICLVAIGLHWYNPFIYYLFYQICKNSEYYCDECVIRNMDQEKRMEYGRLLVYMETKTERSPIFFSNGVSGKKKRVEKRLLHIINYQKKRVTKVFLAMLTGICLIAVFSALVTYHASWKTSWELPTDVDIILQIGDVGESDFAEGGVGSYWNHHIANMLNFDGDDQAFADANGTITYTDSLPIVEICPHQGEDGSYYIHERNLDGSCVIKCYEAKKCDKCGIVLYEAIMEENPSVCDHGEKRNK